MSSSSHASLRDTISRILKGRQLGQRKFGRQYRVGHRYAEDLVEVSIRHSEEFSILDSEAAARTGISLPGLFINFFLDAVILFLYSPRKAHELVKEVHALREKYQHDIDRIKASIEQETRRHLETPDTSPEKNQ